ncbi:MAG TPA: Uma2 family endonuclease [Chloroflexota bacterium]
MRADVATLDWPAEDLFDSEEQDEPLAGQDHRDTIDSLSYPLRGRLAGPHCYVAAELRVLRDQYNHRDYREPDILVALGVADWVRPRYELWVEAKAPDLVIEVLSPSSWDNKDLTEKRNWYRQEGVREYVVLDPSGDFAPEPRLQAWRLGDRPDGSADRHRLAEGGTLWSELIPFGWRVVDNRVRVVDQANGGLFPLIGEVEPQLRREVELRRAAQERAQIAEEHSRQAKEREQLALERERLARQALEWETAARQALEAELARLRQGK